MLMDARIARILVCGVFFAAAIAAAQTPPAFEVASIKPSDDQADQVQAGVRISGAQVRFTRLSLKDVIAAAYRTKTSQIVGPDWIGQMRFDIAAKIPEGTSASLVPEMLQALLGDRFQLKAHRDMKEFAVYALVVGKGGPKLQESPKNEDAAARRPVGVEVAARGSGAGVAVDLGGGSSFSLGNNQFQATKVTLATLADTFTRFVDRPVVNMTGIKGTYDLTLDLTAEDYMGVLMRSAVNAGVVLPPQALSALDRASADPLSGPLGKYGLALEPRKAPLPIVVVDAMQKTPTEN
jgi:uncharacterized protein (TIGR03435 family)